MKSSSLLCLLAVALAPLAASVAHPAPVPAVSDCPSVVVSLPTAAETFSVGTLRVQRYGDHGRPVILIPGLASGSWVWARTVRHLRANHVVYALTLAGFDGAPAPPQKTGLLDQADASLLKLIQSRHIDRPVLVGHSIGGTLAIRFAGEHNDLLGGVVAVEGLPVFPGTQAMTAAQRHARADAMRKLMGPRMANVTPAQFTAQEQSYMEHAMLDSAAAQCYGALAAKSDPAATVEYMAEDYAADYRPGLAHVTVPLLEISPFDAADAKAAAARTGQPARSAKDKAAFYATFLTNDPTARVISIAPARHFVMLDQPQKFQAVLDKFLADLPDAGS